MSMTLPFRGSRGQREEYISISLIVSTTSIQHPVINNSTMKKLIFSLILLSTISTLYAQPGFIIPDEPRGGRAGFFALELQTIQVNTSITGQSATTAMDQVFFNPSRRQLQGYYYFPIPKGASIDHFSMYINGKETEGEILDAKKAKKIYEDIVRRMQDPALLEYFDQGMFRVRIFPIQPRAEQRVKLTYTQTLNKENSTIEYVFPFKHQLMEQKAISEAAFKIDIKSEDKLKAIYCPTHEVEINRKGDNNATLGFEGKNIKSDADFKVYYSTDKSKVGVSMLDYNDGSEDGFFFLNISPGFAEKLEVVEKDIVFVLDCSGSMAGEKMEQARKALNFCVANLNEGDRFNIVRFSTEANSLFDNPLKANQSNLAKANAYIKKLKPIGGTNIDEALALALQNKKSSDRPYFVVFMTDGKPTLGETNTNALLKKVKTVNSDNTRIFTFGIGTELNTHLLDKLTEMTNAYRTYVLPDEDIEIKVSDFYTKVSSPILTDLKIDFDKNVNISQVYPKALPDLFKGSTLSLLGRYSGKGKVKVTVSGKVNGKTEKFSYNLLFSKKKTEHEFIPPLWGARTVGYLMDQVRLHGESKEVKEEITRLAKKYGIITPYTSYLILEDEADLIGQRRIRVQDGTLSNRTNTRRLPPQIREEFEDMAVQESGDNSVRASKETQALNKSESMASTRQGKKRLNYSDAQGNTQNLAEGIRVVQGRAFYNNANNWVDANLQLSKNQNLKVNRVAFNSKAYFDLINNHPESIEYLALGKNVRFVMSGAIWEVYPES